MKLDRYELCKKYKWFDWFDDHVIWYLYDNPKDWIKSINHWFYCNWNREHWELIKAAFTSYGWDHGFMTKLEEKQIDKQIKWFSKHQHMIDEQYNKIMWSLKIAKYCIHHINTDGMDLWHHTGEMKFIPSDNGYLMDNGTLEYHYDGPRINKRNIRRFVRQKQYQYVDKWHEDEIYMLKLKHLYYKILENYSESWWD